ncbi:MAG TPA: cytidine deaminase [Halanaerobiales bacterium]|nr:cytidine deaminase [Halanaerobiales bacterium]
MEVKNYDSLTVEMKKLIEKAEIARSNSYSPYSGFSLGAALLTEDGQVFTGTNIENSSFGLSICAERTAYFKAISEGYRAFKTLVIVTDTPEPVMPCGACRQVINEFNSDIKVLMANFKGKITETTGRELLPASFKFNKGDF